MIRVHRFLFSVISISTLALVFQGCMSGTVDVNGGGASSSRSPKASALSQTTRNSPASGNGFQRTLFFETIADSWGSGILGFDFLSVNSESQNPFNFYFEGSHPASVSYWRPVLKSGHEQIAWIPQTAQGSSVEILDPESMTVSDLAEIPGGQTWILSPDLVSLAGIGSDGALAVVNLASGDVSSTDGKWGSRAQIHWLKGGSGLAINDPESKAIAIYRLPDLNKAVATFRGESFSADPGDKAYLIYSEGKLIQINPASGTSQALDLKVSGFDQASWGDDGRVAFVEGSAASREASIDVLKIESANFPGRLIGKFKVNIGGNPGRICPAWVGSRLFFAGIESTKNIWQIWEGVGQKAKAFAIPDDLDLGFICPKSVSLDGGSHE